MPAATLKINRIAFGATAAVVTSMALITGLGAADAAKGAVCRYGDELRGATRAVPQLCISGRNVLAFSGDGHCFDLGDMLARNADLDTGARAEDCAGRRNA